MRHFPATDFSIEAVARTEAGPALPDRGATGEPLGRLARRIAAIQRRTPFRVIHGRAVDNLSARYVWIGRLLSLVTFGLRYAPSVKRARGIGYGRQFLDQFRLLARGVTPKAYYALQFYDMPDGIGAADHYLGRYETKNGIYNLLRDRRPQIQAAAISIRDKYRFALRCRQLSLPAPEVLALARDGNWISLQTKVGAFDRDLFAKPIRSKGAVGAAGFKFLMPNLYLDADGAVLTRRDLEARLAGMSRSKPFMLMPHLRNHPEIADLAGESAITFRVFTCFDAAHVPVVTHAMLRVLAKLEPDWGSDAEFAAAIDLQSGRLGPMCSDQDYRPQSWGRLHPKTGAAVEGRVIANWPAIAELARLAHFAFPLHLLIGWDIVLTPEGPMLLEGNVKPDVHFLQRVHRQLIGHSPLAPLLRHHLRSAEILVSERVKTSRAQN